MKKSTFVSLAATLMLPLALLTACGATHQGSVKNDTACSSARQTSGHNTEIDPRKTRGAVSSSIQGNSGQPGRTENSSSETDTEKPQNKISLTESINFSAKTPSGDAIDSSIFIGYRLTMINIWGTLCKPCIEELPDLQKLHQDMLKKGVKIIGFIANYQDDRVQKAQEILKKLNITYSNIVFDDATSGAITAQIPGYPTTVFVDSKGYIVGKQVNGAQSYDAYQTIIEERLKERTS